MITKQNKKQTQNGSSALVISIMCAVIMTIIRQSINNHTDTYAGISTNNEIGSQKIHNAASDTTLSVQGSSNILRDITSLIADQKKVIDTYVLGIQDATVGDSDPIGYIDPIMTVNTQTGSLIDINKKSQLQTLPEYLSFQQIKKSLGNKKCNYTLPIDNTDPKIASHIQWGLDHCLITVSAAQKVYPNDVLTHEMLRVIAERAGFTVKMDYASRKAVSREQFLTFFYALQQHHQIGDLPVVSMSTPLKRSEYIIFLHKLFGDITSTINNLTGTVGTTTNSSFVSQVPKSTVSDMTIKEFKELLISQGKKVSITPYDETIIVTPDIMKKILSEAGETVVSSGPASVGIDKEMMKQTLSWFIEKL